MNVQTEELVEAGVETGIESTIIVFNDDVNTFDHVIESFMKILNHTAEQAEQCAWIVHSKGNCKVKQGSYDELIPFCSAILDRGISADIM